MFLFEAVARNAAQSMHPNDQDSIAHVYAGSCDDNHIDASMRIAQEIHLLNYQILNLDFLQIFDFNKSAFVCINFSVGKAQLPSLLPFRSVSRRVTTSLTWPQYLFENFYHTYKYFD